MVFTMFIAGTTNAVGLPSCVVFDSSGTQYQHVVSLDTIFMEIENSDRVYNIEFKIWGVKKRKLNFIKLFILF